MKGKDRLSQEENEGKRKKRRGLKGKNGLPQDEENEGKGEREEDEKGRDSLTQDEDEGKREIENG